MWCVWCGVCVPCVWCSVYGVVCSWCMFICSVCVCFRCGVCVQKNLNEYNRPTLSMSGHTPGQHLGLNKKLNTNHYLSDLWLWTSCFLFLLLLFSCFDGLHPWSVSQKKPSFPWVSFAIVTGKYWLVQYFCFYVYITLVGLFKVSDISRDQGASCPFSKPLGFV